MKKVLVVCSMVILSLFAVGCDKTIELTEEENRLIAEYAAELLLKYDRNIDLKYYDDDEPFVITTEATTEESDEELSTQTDGVASDSDVETMDGASTEETAEDVVSSKDFNMAEFVGIDGVTIKYAQYMILDSYPSYDQEGVYMEIDAPEGYKLLILKFNIENVTNDKKHLDLYEMNLSYNIIVNDTRTAKQMLTILLDDLYTYQGDIEGNMLEETVLLFQVSDSVAESIEDLKLKITYGDNQQTISLQ